MNSLTSLLSIATLPVFFLLFYFWHHDKGEKEPLGVMLKVFFLGILVTIPVAYIEMYLGGVLLNYGSGLGHYLYQFIAAFFQVALVEEAAKLLIVIKVTYRHVKFNEVMDGITYCIIASLGFAILENIFYVLDFGFQTGLLRAVTAIPAHALFSGIMGYYIGLAKFEKDPVLSRNYFLTGLGLAVLFHGIYDYVLFIDGALWGLLIFPLLVYMWKILHRAIKKAHGTAPQPLKFF